MLRSSGARRSSVPLAGATALRGVASWSGIAGARPDLRDSRSVDAARLGAVGPAATSSGEIAAILTVSLGASVEYATPIDSEQRGIRSSVGMILFTKAPRAPGRTEHARLCVSPRPRSGSGSQGQ